AFLSTLNLLNLAEQVVPIALIAFGITFVIISGNIDLSVGAMSAVCGIVAALITNVFVSTALGLLVALAIGVCLGLANGFLVVLGLAHSLIVSLATWFIFAGFAVVVSGGKIITVSDENFTLMGQGELFGVKYSIWVVVVVLAVTWFLLSRTVGGRHVYAAGG